jgi:hypothetical protein
VLTEKGHAWAVPMLRDKTLISYKNLHFPKLRNFDIDFDGNILNFVSFPSSGRSGDLNVNLCKVKRKDSFFL